MRSYQIILLVIVLSLSSLVCLCQITFEKGYFITTSNIKTECFIKNLDWENTPSKIKYKQSLNNEESIISTDSIQQFTISDGPSYTRVKVKIDRSPYSLSKLDNSKSPKFREESLLLKELVSGEANLFGYKDQSLDRFFYSVGDGPITQLVYKRYLKNVSDVGENNSYKQQLKIVLNCPLLKLKDFESLTYLDQKLIEIFTIQNQCNNGPIDSIKYSKTKSYTLRITTGIGLSMLDVKNQTTSIKNVTFDRGINYSIGLELAYILPFNKDKWELLVAPSFQSYQNEASTESEFIIEGTTTSTVDYQSIIWQLGLRYRMFLNTNSNLFINGFILNDSTLSSKYYVTRGNMILNDLEIRTDIATALGFGYRYNKLSIELRVHPPKDIHVSYLNWSSAYTNLHFLVTYDLF